MTDTHTVSASRFSHLSAVALVALTAWPACGTRLDPTRAEIGGRTVELVEAGHGDATVVFEAGFGDDWSPWDEVASEVAEHARVFAYSRPGYGTSDPTPEPRDATTIVEELRALLAARGHAPPYVLVGHSFGGTYMELFAKAHPEEVAGLVLVDPRHRDFTTACAAAGLEGYTIPAPMVATLPPVQIAEFEAFATASEEIDDRTFGAYPVRVLTASLHPWSPAVEAMWRTMLGELADEAEDGSQILFVGAGHYLQIDRADEVVREILEIVRAR